MKQENRNDKPEAIQDNLEGLKDGPSIRIKFSYKKGALVGSIVFLVISILLRQIDLDDLNVPILKTVLPVLSDVMSVFAVSVVIASVTWLSDISSIFSQTILHTKKVILDEVREIKDEMDFTKDLSRFPFENLQDRQLLDLTKMTINESIKRHTNEESPTQTRLVDELHSYYYGIIDDIHRGVIYNYYRRDIEIEPDEAGKLTVRMRLSQSLELSANSWDVSFFHCPVFPSKEYAETLEYETIQVDGSELLDQPKYVQKIGEIQEIGESNKKYRRGWEYELYPDAIHTLHMVHSVRCEDPVYFHSAVLAYPCAKFEVTCKVIGPYKDQWRVNADAFYPKGHRFDSNHQSDIIKKPLDNGENGFRIVQNTSCLLDGTAYKFVVYKH